MGTHKCKACGQFAGRGHRCPTTISRTSPAQPKRPTNRNTRRSVTDRVTKATAYLNTPTDTTGLQQDAYEDFLASYGHKYGDLASWPTEQFAGLCEAVNGDYARHLRDTGNDPILRDYAGNGTGGAPRDYPHTVTVHDGLVYDFTYRQINPTAPIPVIVPVDEWEQHWRPVGYDRTGNDLDDEEDDDYFFF